MFWFKFFWCATVKVDGSAKTTDMMETWRGGVLHELTTKNDGFQNLILYCSETWRSTLRKIRVNSRLMTTSFVYWYLFRALNIFLILFSHLTSQTFEGNRTLAFKMFLKSFFHTRMQDCICKFHLACEENFFTQFSVYISACWGHVLEAILAQQCIIVLEEVDILVLLQHETTHLLVKFDSVFRSVFCI